MTGKEQRREESSGGGLQGGWKNMRCRSEAWIIEAANLINSPELLQIPAGCWAPLIENDINLSHF